MRRRSFSLALPVLASQVVGLGWTTVAAQDAWPSRTIRIVTPSPAGVGADAFARLYAEQLGKALGVTVIVDNKPGAAGTLGTDAAAKAVPDGYTLLLTTSLPLTVVPHLFPKLPYKVNDLVPVAQLYRGGSFVIASPSFAGNSRTWSTWPSRSRTRSRTPPMAPVEPPTSAWSNYRTRPTSSSCTSRTSKAP